MAKICSNSTCRRREEREEVVFCPECGSPLEPEKAPQPAPAPVTGFEHCAACANDNFPGTKFCGRCGEPLYIECAKCGAKNRPVNTFCGECGSTLPGRNGHAASRAVSHPEILSSAPKQPRPSATVKLPKPVTQVKAPESAAPKGQPRQISVQPGKPKDSAGAERKAYKSIGIIAVLLLVTVAAFYLLRQQVPTYAEAKATCKVGDTFTYGSYPQGQNGEVEPIEWRVLARESDRLLVISEYALDAKAYNEGLVDITWSKCTLRTWLNCEFINKAFTAEEQRNLMKVTLSNSNSHWDSSVSGGPDTEDQVFLLSYDEAEKYFSGDVGRCCKATAYAVEQGALVSENVAYACNCWWWLRSPGSNADDAAVVYSDGSLNSLSVTYFTGAVRPAAFMAL